MLRAEIARTRAELSDNVDTLTETANPRTIADRQVTKVKSAARGVREHLMGAPDDPYDAGTLGEQGTVKDRASSALGSVQDGASDALDTVNDAPRQVQRKTRGNPLAAGLIAFGIGYLISGAVPASRKEQEAASRLQDMAAPLTDKIREAASDVTDRLREPAQEAVASIKDTAADAVANVKDQGATRQGRCAEPGPGLCRHGQRQPNDALTCCRSPDPPHPQGWSARRVSRRAVPWRRGRSGDAAQIGRSQGHHRYHRDQPMPPRRDARQRVGREGESHRRTRLRLADHDSPASQKSPPRPQGGPAEQIGAARGRIGQASCADATALQNATAAAIASPISSPALAASADGTNTTNTPTDHRGQSDHRGITGAEPPRKPRFCHQPS